MKQLETNDSVNVVMKAKVEGVCQAKGCWMNLVDPAVASDEELFVKFKDYASLFQKISQAVKSWSKELLIKKRHQWKNFVTMQKMQEKARKKSRRSQSL